MAIGSVFDDSTATDPFGSTATGGDFSGGGTTQTGGNAFSGVGNFIEKNPGTVLGGAALGANLLFGGSSASPAETALTKNAAEAGSQARTLAAYQQSGTLPPGLQAVVDQQFEASKAAVTTEFSHLGLGGSTMLADRLNQLKQTRSAEIAGLADRLAGEGIAWDRLAAGEWGALLSAQQARDTQLTGALVSFAKGIAGFGGTSTNTSG